jgi:hypothetical protein
MAGSERDVAAMVGDAIGADAACEGARGLKAAGGRRVRSVLARRAGRSASRRCDQTKAQSNPGEHR